MSATPEEVVRQRVLQQMMECGYPKHLLAVEKSLKDLVLGDKVPQRRVDILCFSKKQRMPILMLECKAMMLNQKAIYQVIGYNKFIQASFIALADPYKIITGWYDSEKKDYRFIEKLLPYETLFNYLST